MLFFLHRLLRRRGVILIDLTVIRRCISSKVSFCVDVPSLPVANPDISWRGGHEMRLNAKGTVGRFGGRKLIYNKIITRKRWGGGGPCPWPHP